MNRIRASVAAVIALTAVFPAFTAAPGTSLGGRVIDPDGGLVARLEADVTLTNVQSGAVFKGRLTRDGRYSVSGLPDGTYNIDMVVPSRMYERYQRANVVVAGGKAVELDLSVPWGMNLGTVGDDPLLQGADLRAKTRNVDGPVARLPDGKPDLSGVWTNIGDAVAPPPMPLKPWAQEMADKLAAIRQDNPGAYCLPQVAIPSLINYPTRFVVAADRIIQLTEDMDPGYRQIFMDGRPHPDPDHWNPSWYGHSIGHWEGDTLVVDTVGFNEITPGFSIHSEKLHVIERYTRISHGRMRVELLAEDPEAWTQPHRRSWMMGLAEGAEIVEFVCAEGYASQVSKRAPWRGRP